MTGFVARFRRKKKRLYSVAERGLSQLPPRYYLRLLPPVFRAFHPRATIDSRVRIDCGSDGLWFVSDAFGEFRIPSHRRFTRYYSCGIENRLLDVLSRYLPRQDWSRFLQDKVVVDVGANVGEFSVAALRAGVRLCLALEPDPVAAACLKRNLESFGTRARVHQELADEVERERRFYLAPATADSSFIAPAAATESISLHATTVDALLARTHTAAVQLLKVEAEGAEPEVLRGCRRLLAEQSAVVVADTSCERNGESTFDECSAILRSHGYEVQRLLDGMQLLALKPSRGTNG